jgi:hypothetical protein
MGVATFNEEGSAAVLVLLLENVPKCTRFF